MTNLALDETVAIKELERFFVVADVFHQETGKRAFMPACPVDSEWHALLDSPEEYSDLCTDTVGREIKHQPAKGEGQIEWAALYEKLYGPLPDIWFRDANGNLNQSQLQEYIETGIFYASWDCTPY